MGTIIDCLPRQNEGRPYIVSVIYGSVWETFTPVHVLISRQMDAIRIIVRFVSLSFYYMCSNEILTFEVFQFF